MLRRKGKKGKKWECWRRVAVAVPSLSLVVTRDCVHIASERNKDTMAIKNAPDLTQRPPRSPRVRLGGYVILPRMLDKGRAQLAGKNGEYNYACPMDQRFLEFAGVDPAALKDQLAAGKGDREILEWIRQNAKNKRTETEILAWSAAEDVRPPANVDGREFFHGLHVKIAPKRDDIYGWFDLLDLDDYVSFGGQA